MKLTMCLKWASILEGVDVRTEKKRATEDTTGIVIKRGRSYVVSTRKLLEFLNITEEEAIEILRENGVDI